MTMLQHGLVPSTGGYQIERSLRFNSADSTYLSRTPGTTGNRRTFTFSTWVKLSSISTDPFLIGAGSGGQIWIVSEKLRVRLNGSPDYYYDTAAVLRDFSSWYHIVVAVDTTDATSADRVKIYINSTRQTIGASSAPPQNFDTEFNLSSTAHQIGKWPSGSQYLNGYMADVHFIDGSALTPSSFGENDTDTGVWKPKAYTGSYGTNGFKLTFSDNSGTTSTTLGKDTSGNGNNWTPNNFSVTAGAGNDSLVDTPTPYGTDTGAGGSVRGNYCVVNPLDSSSGNTLSNGNLDLVGASGAAWRSNRSTFGISSGKWYWEVLCTNIVMSNDRTLIGIMKSSANLGSFVGSDTSGWGYYSGDGNKYTNSVGTSYGASFTTNDIIGVAFDADNGELKFYKNGTVQNSGTAAFTGLTSGPYFPAIGMYGGSVSVNFGQRPFAYTAPSGFKALCTTNLPTPTIGATSSTRAGKYFNVALWTGNASTQNITGVGFEPDFIWIKDRSVGPRNHYLFDRNRGITNARLFSNLTNAEDTSTTYINSTNSDGYQLASGDAGSNGSGETYVGWNWKGGGTGVSNTAGSITSTVSANTTSGFSIVTYTGTGSNATVGHGLGVVPKLVIVKHRSAASGGPYNWRVYHASTGATGVLALNTTAAFASSSGAWNDTAPTSTVFSIGTDLGTNASTTTYVAYCFAEVAGYSAFGSYTGNGSADGPMIFTGFRPAFVMLKLSNGTSDWYILDNKRSGFNVGNDALYPNASYAENSGLTYPYLDLTSNGFKIRSSSYNNSSGFTYIYAAFAEAPFKYALAR